MGKKVLILSGSPRKGGNSDTLCDQFMKGALEEGNEVEKGVIYGKGVYVKGEILEHPAFAEAYEMGKTVK